MLGQRGVLLRRIHVVSIVLALTALLNLTAPAWAEDEAPAPVEGAGGEGGVLLRSPLDWFVIPLVGFTPDTSVALATIGIVRFRFLEEPLTSRPSTIALLLTWTFNNQILTQLGTKLYFDNERTYLRWETIFEDWPELFFGVGPDTPIEAREALQRRNFVLKAHLRRSILDRRLYVGFIQDFSATEISSPQPGGLIDRGLVPGARGGLRSGLGLSLTFDSRDSDVFPLEGAFVKLTSTLFSRRLASDFDGETTQLDARWFFEVAQEHVMALQLIATMNSGEIPFFAMAELGGMNQSRGLLKGRFRDKHGLVGQVEYRSPYVWRISGVLFGSAGQVAPDLAALGLETIKVAGGGGLRFGVNPDEGINMRLDFGVAQDGSFGAYLGFTEAF